jgi:hypothetical protein
MFGPYEWDTKGAAVAWVTVAGLAGKVYVPGDAGQTQKKHPCSACFSCQWCDENRCQVCRNGDAQTGEPSSTGGCCAVPKANTPQRSGGEADKTLPKEF